MELDCAEGLVAYQTQGDCCAKCVSRDLLTCNYEGKVFQVGRSFSLPFLPDTELHLYGNDMFSSFFDTVISHSLYPQITRPTRFTRNGTLIDHLFFRLHKSILENTAGI